MKPRPFSIAIGVLALAALLLMSAGGTSAQGPNPPSHDVQGSGTAAEPSSLTGTGTQLTYQGRLTSSSGASVNSPVQMVFKIYDDSGALLWTSATRTVTPANGLFTVYLGEGSDPSLTSTVLSTAASVGVTVGSDAEMTPRQPLNTIVGHSTTGYGVFGNSGSGIGVRGSSTSNNGVHGVSGTGTGVYGYSNTGNGVQAISTSGTGVYASSNITGVYAFSASGTALYGYSAGSKGVYGENNASNGFGVYGASTSSTSGTGVYGSSKNGSGVEGTTTNAFAAIYGHASHTGVFGQSSSSGYSGVQGENTGNGYGVYGDSLTSGIGVYGSSSSGTGVYGTSSTGKAGYFNGDIAQSRTGDGLVKAGVFAFCTGPANIGTILRSFNNVGGTISFSPGASTGLCTLDFGFQIDDRYFIATATVGKVVSCNTGSGETNTKLNCQLNNSATGAAEDGNIMVLIY
jgi:hypothetical protein